jgi:hypothetical protein
MGSFQAAMACRSDPKNQGLYKRKRDLERLGERLGEAIQNEEDCECKNELQGLFDNWTVTPSSRRSPGDFPAKTKLITEGGNMLVQGNVIGGHSTFYTNSWPGIGFVFYHEFAHMTPGVLAVPSAMFPTADDPGEVAASEYAAYLRSKVYGGGSLCR